MKFGFVAKHRGVWPVRLMCEALSVSRGAASMPGLRGPRASGNSWMSRLAHMFTRALSPVIELTGHAESSWMCWSLVIAVVCIRLSA